MSYNTDFATLTYSKKPLYTKTGLYARFPLFNMLRQAFSKLVESMNEQHERQKCCEYE